MSADSAQRQEHEGSWRWSAAEGRLDVTVGAGSRLSDLRGTWALDGIDALLDGLSRGRLRSGLSGEDVSVNCALTLSDGRQVQLVGAFVDAGDARGLILSAERAGQRSEPEPPGPELEPAYQPVFSLASGTLAGHEALARWTGPGAGAHRHDDEGLASNMLIRAAETLGDWQALTGRPDLFIQVNLTGRDLEQTGLVDLVEALVEGYGFQPGTLRIELTEQAALRDLETALNVARNLVAAGAGIVLDDFGSGHSSFAWLAELPAISVKVDADLIRHVGEVRYDAILRAVTGLAHDLGMTATAEGIERDEQLALVRALGFDFGQGFALGRPVARDQAEAALKS